MLRSAPPGKGDPSPWGLIDHTEPLGPDAVTVGTSSHGGIWVSPAALARMPVPLRETAYSRGGWFEEDCDWALPYLALGLDAFEPDGARAAEMHAAAVKTVQRWHPEHAALLGVPAVVTERRDA